MVLKFGKFVGRHDFLVDFLLYLKEAFYPFAGKNLEVPGLNQSVRRRKVGIFK